MAAMETSEVVEVLREIRDIQRKSAQFQRKVISGLSVIGIAALLCIPMLLVGGPQSFVGGMLFFGALIAFVIGCISLGFDLFHYRF